MDSPSARWGLRPQAPMMYACKFGDNIAQFSNLMGRSDLSYDLPFGRYRARNFILSEKISGMSNVRAFCRLTMEDRAKSHWTFFVVHFIPDYEFFVRSELAPTVRPLSGLQKRPAGVKNA
ncbi:hypothetical protein J6590_077461 [Homalodisca vitripennis]|nr:hypothetical protein J6590_077461 [Homalodisca vitripennis]